MKGGAQRCIWGQKRRAQGPKWGTLVCRLVSCFGPSVEGATYCPSGANLGGPAGPVAHMQVAPCHPCAGSPFGQRFGKEPSNTIAEASRLKSASTHRQRQPQSQARKNSLQMRPLRHKPHHGFFIGSTRYGVLSNSLSNIPVCLHVNRQGRSSLNTDFKKSTK